MLEDPGRLRVRSESDVPMLAADAGGGAIPRE